MNTQLTDKQFEDEVRRIARALWPSAQHDGAANIEGQERDGVFVTEDVVQLVECTTSRGRDKAIEDANKLAKLAAKLGPLHITKAIKCWFITREEPTADQREAIKKHQGLVVSMSFAQFRAKLVDVRSYLTARNNYPFGSVRDPSSGRMDYDLSDYVPLDMVETPSNELWSFSGFVEKVVSGKRFVILGDYGAGKSSTLRQLFKELAKEVWKNHTAIFPVMLNLRDHHGEKDPSEALYRHAKSIGFSEPFHLVRAWRASEVLLLLDGFDEIAVAGWAGRTKKLQDLRYQSMELIRQFIRQTPDRSSVVVSGRAHFFDDSKELDRALGLENQFTILNLNEFTEEQVNLFLKKKGWHQSIPDWLPSRPLLLGYLASKNLLQEAMGENNAPTPAAGWHALLQRICKRESEIEVGIDPDTIRQIIERLATYARKTNDGLGPLLPHQITQAFIDIVGQPPDDRGHILIQRLPGLGVNVDKNITIDAFNSQDGSRRFIDQTFAEAASAGDVFRFVQDSYNSTLESSQWICSLQQLGIEVLSHRCALAGFGSGKLSAAISDAGNRERQGTLCADIVRALLTMGLGYSGSKAFVRGAEINELQFDEPDAGLSELHFQEVIIHELTISADVDSNQIPTFENSIIDELHGRTGWSDLPTGKFPGTQINRFGDSSATNTGILRQDSLPNGTKVLLTMLRKIFLQKGRGRRENALYRGIDPAIRHLVTLVLQELRREEFVTLAHYTDQTVWLPVRSADKRQRALRMIDAPHDVNDPLAKKCSELQ